MKKLFIILSILFLCSSSFAGNIDKLKSVIARKNVGCVPQAKITFWWECEDTTPEYTGGDSEATKVGTADLTADADYSGTNGCDFPAAGDHLQFDETGTGVWTSEAKIGFWVYVNSGFGNNSPFYLRAELDTDKPQLELKSGNSDSDFKLTIDNLLDDSINISGSDAMQTATWYWVEAYYKQSTGDVGILIYNSSLTLIDSTTGNDTIEAIGTPDDFEIGNVAGAADLYMDHIIVVNDSTLDLRPCANETSFPY